MKIAGYIASQIALFVSVAIFLRLTYFPEPPPGESPDWAVTLAYGSLSITPLIALRRDRNRFLTILGIAASWVACRFTGNDLILPLVIYFVLACVSGILDSKVVPVVAGIAAVYTAFLFKIYGDASNVPEVHFIGLNLLYVIAVLQTGSMAFPRGNHEEETPASDSYEDYRKAA